MDKLEELYNMTKLQKKSIGEQIDLLQKNENVKKYIELCMKKSKLKMKETELFKEICFSKYDSCDHVWINTLHHYDEYEGKSFNYYGCVKCGLDKRVYHLNDQKKRLTQEQVIMLDYLANRYKGNGLYTKLSLDLNTAREFYQELIQSNPTISDEELINALNSYVEKKHTTEKGKKLVLKK